MITLNIPPLTKVGGYIPPSPTGSTPLGQNTCILGRDLLSKLGTVESNWLDNQIRIGDFWKDPQIAIQGGEPLTRACVLESLDFATSDPDYKLDIVKRNISSDELRVNLNPLRKTHWGNILLEYSDVFKGCQPLMTKTREESGRFGNYIIFHVNCDPWTRI